MISSFPGFSLREGYTSSWRISSKSIRGSRRCPRGGLRTTLLPETGAVDYAKVVGAIAEFFEREKVPFALAGAFALHAYGLSRATSDIDFVTESGVRQQLVEF